MAASDKAYNYDRNPNRIASQTLNLTLPAGPVVASQPSCLSGGAIGVLNDGVVLFNALDGQGRDAAAYETLDSCEGHPERTSEYHHHNVPACLLAQAKQASTATLVGYANDGFGIYVERDKNGNLPANSSLDACHGRTSAVLWDGKQTTIYHYDATLEFPYTLGCYRGVATTAKSGSATSPTTGQQSKPAVSPTGISTPYSPPMPPPPPGQLPPPGM